MVSSTKSGRRAVISLTMASGKSSSIRHRK
jgi:hypothetical protein